MSENTGTRHVVGEKRNGEPLYCRANMVGMKISIKFDIFYRKMAT